MRTRNHSVVAALFLVPSLICTVPSRADQPSLPTVAERTEYRATSRYDDVVSFCDALAKRSPLVRLGELGTSGAGRKLPLLILADPPIATPEEAAKSGKLVILAIGNIHAGEVDGKEALLALARDIVLAKERPLLKDLVIVFCPIFNADGNEPINKANRPEQNGPVDGVGLRENAAGLDLNRDFVKLESPEVRALVRAIRKWDPALFIDAHTTNGSYHRYPMTYDGPRHPACPPGLVEAVRDNLLPDAAKSLEKTTGFPSFWYGNFEANHTRWETYPAEPRYGIQYVGLRGRLSVLTESYSYAKFVDRVVASREFIRGCLEHVAAHKDQIRKLVQPAKPPEKLPLKTKAVVFGDELKALGYVEEKKDGRNHPTDKEVTYAVQYLGKVEPTLTVATPYAYLVPASYAKAIEVLQRHGVVLEELREDIDLDVEIYRVDKVTRATRAFQKHNLVAVDATSRKASQRVPAGTVLVKTAQPLGTMAALFLEPQCEDGLTTWNFFDAGLAEGKDFPVLRLPAAASITSAPVRPLAEDRTMNKPFTTDQIYGRGAGPNLSGNPANVQSWLDDGEHFLQIKGGELRKVEARTGRSERYIDPAKVRKSLETLTALEGDFVRSAARGPFYRLSPRNDALLVTQGDDLYIGRLDGSPGVRLTRSAGPKEFVTFSPDGNFVAFVRAGNLFVVDVATQTEKALTTDGGGQILNGKADWVYYEEVFNRRGSAYWWSPDSRSLAFLRFDDAPVHTFTVVNELPVRQKVESTPYPKAGDPNPHVKLGLAGVGGGEATFADLSAYSPTDSLVMHVGWTPDSEKLLFYVQNRAQTWLDVCTCGARGGPTTRLLRETTKAWVDDPGEPTFLKDGSFLMSSQRTGWRHLYHFDKDGKLVRPVTSGDWEVRTLHKVDEKSGWLYFSGTKDSAIAPNLYRCKLDGSDFQRLTTTAGSHQVVLSPNAAMFVDSATSFDAPTHVSLHGADGALLRVIDSNPVYVREEYQFGAFEHVAIPLADGFVMEGTLVKPPDFDPAKRYPVWLMTYAGPHAPTVRDSWDGGRLLDQVLARQGLIVFHCDPRSASGKGACSTWTAYRQLGIQELKDLEGAVDWLCQKPYVDGKRIGLSGSSYGGFMTLFALTHSKRFAAGVAGAPVTDWHNYDSVYTERYMNTPQENPEGYAKTSVVKAAANLHGKLLLQHGVMDDNVHFQNALQLIDALQKADKDFEVMFYPTARHGGFGRHAQRQMVEFIKRTLGGPEGGVAESATPKSAPPASATAPR